MDQTIRNKLRSVVTQCRKLLQDAVTQTLEGHFGIYDGNKGEVHVEDETRMTHLSEEEQTYRKDILDHFEHIKVRGCKPKEALEQLIREIAFTHLNRLCAYKLMEARQVWIGGQRFRGAVSRGQKSQGFMFYLADHPEDEHRSRTGQQDVAYRHFLDWLGGTLSEEIGVLFNPNDPANRLYPPQRVLDDVLALINDEELTGIWSEDETIGWVYQYFTPKELRDQARKESQAPRNSYELAFRNQFFTPRYVVEFLSDNTLGHIWYEMRKGDTKLKDQCRYMIRRPNSVSTTIFIRLLANEDKGLALADAVCKFVHGQANPLAYAADPQSLSQVPGSPFAYWVDDRIRQLFKALSRFEGDGRAVRQGLATADDFRFVRTWWEVPAFRIVNGTNKTTAMEFRQQTFQGKRWVSFAKRGEYSPYYLDIHLLVNWERDGEEIRAFINPATGRTASRPQNTDYYFRPGLTWALRSTSGFGLRVLPGGTIFGHKGPAAFVKAGTELVTLGILFSQAYQRLIEVSLAAGEETQSGTASRSYEVGLIQRLPWPDFSRETIAEVSQHVSQIINGVCRRDSSDETTRLFQHPIFSPSQSLWEATLEWQRGYESEVVKLLCNAADVETIAHRILGLHSDDRSISTGDARTLCKLPIRELDSSFDAIYCRSIHETIREELDEGGGDRQIAVKSFYVSRRIEVLAQTLKVHPEHIARVAAERRLLPDGLLFDVSHRLVSYGLGCVFGRWDIRYATGDRQPVTLPDPFAPIPVCAPGMLQDADSLPLAKTPEAYPLQIDWDSILVDEPNHHDDIIHRVQDVLELIWKDRADAIEKEASEILGVKELRDYFRKPGKGGFWDDHISHYSKSRRKAPIYWLLQSSKKNYALWIYYHRLDKDILFKALLNYVEPKIRLEENRLEPLRAQRAGVGASDKGVKKLAKDIERQDELISELRDFEDKLRRVANLHLEPDFNDGVVLNIAPLWELVPWREARNYWEELLGGKYEWSSIGKQLREKGIVRDP